MPGREDDVRDRDAGDAWAELFLRHGGAVTKDRRLAVPAPPLLPPAVTQNRLGHGPRYIPPPAPASPSAPDPSARKAGSA